MRIENKFGIPKGEKLKKHHKTKINIHYKELSGFSRPDVQ